MSVENENPEQAAASPEHDEAELRAMDEAIERARADGATIIEGNEDETLVIFVGEEGLERVRKALGREDE